MKNNVNSHTYLEFFEGLGQTQWNFQPKSIYKSLSTTWNIFPMTILPSGSPNYNNYLMSQYTIFTHHTYIYKFGISQQRCECLRRFLGLFNSIKFVEGFSITTLMCITLIGCISRTQSLVTCPTRILANMFDFTQYVHKNRHVRLENYWNFIQAFSFWI